MSVFTKEDLSYVPTLPDRNFDQELESFEITQDDVLKKLGTLKASKSAGPDGLHCKFLLELKEVLCKPLTVIFNKSLESGEVPTQWKRAHVSPISEFSITPIWAYFYACFSFRTPKIHCHGFSLTPCFFPVTRPKLSINYVKKEATAERSRQIGRIAAKHCSKIKQVTDTCH